MIEEGKLYLFKIYNKDFSPSSKGTPNLHTMYFKKLFDYDNLQDVVYKLNGEAEMFYREASINDAEKVVHPANEPIANKNPDNPHETSVFRYDIVKDKRFTKRQFLLHLPITINFKSEGNKLINYKVRNSVKKDNDTYVIGVDRGERNLVYVCVINSKGEIAEQMSLNDIIDETTMLKTDYRKKLDEREKARKDERQSWKAVEGIKELKEGYISQVVHKICQLAVKYDAVIALEDLNQKFKNSRIKIEKQVYQKFENMLINKLSLLMDKKLAHNEPGGAMKAYQLVNSPSEKINGRQNGFIFYVNPWLTSKIDPTTGFADLIKPRFVSVKDSKEVIGKIESIKYNECGNYFEFDFDMSKFPGTDAMYRKNWVICTYGERIRSFKNEEHRWVSEKLVLTDMFQKLFAEYGITVSDTDMRGGILACDSKDFHERFIKLLALTLQMRNNVSNTDIDYLISPVKNKAGEFYDSRKANDTLPLDADANGAYNIARKALCIINEIKETPEDELAKVSFAITNAKWLEFAQK